jgi:hypothetical protein
MLFERRWDSVRTVDRGKRSGQAVPLLDLLNPPFDLANSVQIVAQFSTVTRA